MKAFVYPLAIRTSASLAFWAKRARQDRAAKGLPSHWRHISYADGQRERCLEILRFILPGLSSKQRREVGRTIRTGLKND